MTHGNYPLAGSSTGANPLVSVIITTYNHAHYLSKAIESALMQDYGNIEVVVVDDGSTDNTKSIVANYPSVHYIYQSNNGLSAARNAGIDNSAGELLLFLDADDWLLNGAICLGVRALDATPDAAFAYGMHDKVNERGDVFPGDFDGQNIAEDHYRHLLHYNFIAMHAAVLYRRSAFDGIRFDPALKACEDYDVLLKITRHNRVVFVPHALAAYRRHSQNMSGDARLMIRTGMEVMDRQVPLLRNDLERDWLKKGRSFWKEFYLRQLRQDLQKTAFLQFDRTHRRNLVTFFIFGKKQFLTYLLKRTAMGLKSVLKRTAPKQLLLLLHRAGIYKAYRPVQGQLRLGDFASARPFSNNFGYDRGGPVDRYYIENFLAQNAAHIKGRVLEIGDNDYTIRFGGGRVTQSDVLHVEEGNPKATFVGDLSDAPHLPSNSFDCIVLTQTLHLIYRHVEALQTCYRVLRPGGTLLLTTPGITHIDQGDWREYWYWSYTETALKKLLSEAFPPGSFQTETFGNVLVATAFLWGMGKPELSQKDLDTHDPHYQVIITAKATKPLTA